MEEPSQGNSQVTSAVQPDVTDPTPAVTQSGSPIVFTVTRRRLVIIVLSVVALAIVAVVVANDMFGTRTGGPLASKPGTRFRVEQRVEPGLLYTWGMNTPQNTTGQDIRIDSIDPLGIDGIEVVGVTVTRDGSIGTAIGYPPEEYDFELMLPEGAALPAESGSAGLAMLFGVRLKNGRDVGTISRIRLRYHVGRRAYETVYPWSLRLYTEAHEQERPS